MVTCIDGPAKDQQFAIRRIPKYLRVVKSRRGNWDVLDQLDDEPKRTEQIFVYVRRDDMEISKMHVRACRRSLSGYYFTCSYSVHPEQPADSEIRSTDAWRAWTESQVTTRSLFDSVPDA